MPIKKRDSTDQPVQVPAREHKRDPNAVLHGFKDYRKAATILYDEISPKEVPIDDLVKLIRTPQNDDNMDRVYRNRIRGRMTAIRAFCVFCVGSSKKVRTCESLGCPLWPFRMGNNPFNRKG